VSAYLDSATAAPLHPVARQALLAALEDGWADPDRLYGASRRARILLDAAAESIAESIGARPDEVIFTSSGVAAVHAAVLGTLRGHARPGRPTRLVYSAVEHSAVLNAARAHSDDGGLTDAVEVDSLGRVAVEAFARAAAGADVAALQAANHEVGTTQPVAAVAAAIEPVPLIVDTSQTLATAPEGWSVLTADPRVWGAGPGIGLLVVRTGVRWSSPYPEDERRLPGVPNVPAAVAAAASLRAIRQSQADDERRMRGQIERIRAHVAATVPDVDVLGDPVERVPHLVTFSCLYVDGEAVLSALDRRGFAVSSGSSCMSSALEPSHVLVAMGALTSGNIRVSVNPATSDDEVSEFLGVLPGVIADVRAELGATGL
jgi:cysteine desulfurase